MQTGTYDAGGSWSINWDFDATQTLQSDTTVYKAGGILWCQTGIYDNGTTWSVVF